MPSLILQLVLWSSVALLVYTYALYPVTLGWVTRLAGGRAGRTNGTQRLKGARRPSVDVIVAAYNEEEHVLQRIRNVLEQDYDGELRILIGSDGSIDRTPQLLASAASARVLPFVFPANRGKASTLNDLVAASTADLLVFSDANTFFERDAVARLVDAMMEGDVACACGELKLVAAAGTNEDSRYWAKEQALKRMESSIGVLVGANGAIYCIRRRDFRALPADTIVDDFCVAMKAALVSADRLVYVPEAVATETCAPDMSEEFGRRLRIGIGNYQALFRYPQLLWRLGPAMTFAYVSHKVLRWLGPHLLLIILLSNLLLVSQPFYANLLAAQALLYGFCLAAYRLRNAVQLPKIVNAVVFLLMLNLAFLIAFCRYIRGSYRGSWVRSARAS